MLRDITIGQYYPADSTIHRLDPRTKLAGTLVFIISLFMFRTVGTYMIATLALVAIIRISKVPFKFMIKGLKAIILLLMFTVLFSVFMTPGDPLITFFGRFTITKQGVWQAGFMIVRLTYLIVGSSLMTLTTTPNSLTDGIESGLGFLRIVKVPVHEIAMMMSIALRFIPILLEETDKIMKAQSARGADFESGGLIKRATNLVPLLVPLFISAFRRATDLAMAMEARGYRGGDGRTKMKPLLYKSQDKMAYLLMVVYFILLFLVKRFVKW